MVAISSTRLWYTLSCHLHNWRLGWRVAWVRHLHHLEPLFTDWHLWWSLMHCMERKSFQSHIDNLVVVILRSMAPSTKKETFLLSRLSSILSVLGIRDTSDFFVWNFFTRSSPILSDNGQPARPHSGWGQPGWQGGGAGSPRTRGCWGWRCWGGGTTTLVYPLPRKAVFIVCSCCCK